MTAFHLGILRDLDIIMADSRGTNRLVAIIAPASVMLSADDNKRNLAKCTIIGSMDRLVRHAPSEEK